MEDSRLGSIIFASLLSIERMAPATRQSPSAPVDWEITTSHGGTLPVMMRSLIELCQHAKSGRGVPGVWIKDNVDVSSGIWFFARSDHVSVKPRSAS